MSQQDLWSPQGMEAESEDRSLQIDCYRAGDMIRELEFRQKGERRSPT